jgi:hypothetical protein
MVNAGVLIVIVGLFGGLGLIIDASSFERTQRKMSPAPSLEEGTRSRFQNAVCFSVL